MNITVLGASGGEAPGLNLTGFRIDESVLLDAGTIGKSLTLDEQLKIRHILITHSHLDHIHALPFMLDNLINRIEIPVKVYSPTPVLDVIRENIFNNKIWPDFTVLPSRENPVVEFVPVEPEAVFEIGDYQVKAVQVEHSFMAMAYIITGKNGSVVFTGDTGISEKIWENLKSLKNLKAVFMECSFPENMENLARMTKHLCVSDIVPELAKAEITSDIPVYLYHLKPAFTVQIMAEANEIKSHKVKVVSPGDQISF